MFSAVFLLKGLRSHGRLKQPPSPCSHFQRRQET